MISSEMGLNEENTAPDDNDELLVNLTNHISTTPKSKSENYPKT